MLKKKNKMQKIIPFQKCDKSNIIYLKKYKKDY